MTHRDGLCLMKWQMVAFAFIMLLRAICFCVDVLLAVHGNCECAILFSGCPDPSGSVSEESHWCEGLFCCTGRKSCVLDVHFVRPAVEM